jgi:hypothetical protein
MKHVDEGERGNAVGTRTIDQRLMCNGLPERCKSPITIDADDRRSQLFDSRPGFAIGTARFYRTAIPGQPEKSMRVAEITFGLGHSIGGGPGIFFIATVSEQAFRGQIVSFFKR